MSIFGRRDVWAIEVEALAGPPPEADPAAASTWCSLRIWVEGRNLTAHARTDTLTTEDSIHWPAAYLARWFLHAWTGFWERAGWPLPGPVIDAEVACSRLDAHLAELGEEATDEQLTRRDDFIASHTLLAAAGGGVMPHVYLMREGDGVHIVWKSPRGGGSEAAFLDAQGRATIDADFFLDSIASFLGWCRDAVETRAPILAAEIADWLDRVDSPQAAEASLRGYIRPWGVGDTQGSVADLDQTLGLPPGWRSAGSRLDPSRYSAAVLFRALAPVLEITDVEKLLRRLRAFPSIPDAGVKLTDLGNRLVASSREPPHQQGYLLAQQLRHHLQNPDRFFDVEALLRDLGVPIEEEELSDTTIDAATVWDDQHGPVIVINTLGSRNTAWARRMTLAHELCHLLTDRTEAVPLMIASTPWAPPELEKRANAFAAELLLPKQGLLRVAGAAVHAGWFDDDIRQRLMDEFQIGATVCDRQIENRLQIFE